MDRNMDNKQKIRLGMYVTGIAIVILSRITTLIEYNIAMTIASFLLSLTLFIDAYNYYQKNRKIRMAFCLFFALLLIVLLIYLWMFMI
ncbi:hypothetical protein M2475_000732 [Breznakia sp. PF5-3]|uniref:hypothetical protein n=1 Tax=unclassified Breznakia TaxID=2623764 RepID=UPI002406AB7A|nr:MULTISPECIES: hypothetical protein [unclassified Breznakia]MDF9824262.1 hypothetical protein [Breznakia sp. PM6-1]MDF9835171.1 hypothetical protein [Breznakia sp. PF5-3]MDF9837283.1 hypothetical protein [Breznakia sp. PFB2-8]MDF9859418.1 hypothetical protein [Breznakia sp. PH5-24]